MSAAAAITAASRATAGRRRTAVPREAPELRTYKTEDQEKVFRAAEINDAELIRNAKALDEGCRKWIAKALGRKKVGKLTAQVLGLGANARNVPAGEWPKPTGGLFGSIRRYIS